jgi:hypothetical protein
MSPLSTGVLGAATLVSSPALWLGLVDRTLPLDVALTRYLIALALCWAALSLVATWAFPDARPVRAEAQQPSASAEPGETATSRPSEEPPQ